MTSEALGGQLQDEVLKIKNMSRWALILCLLAVILPYSSVNIFLEIQTQLLAWSFITSLIVSRCPSKNPYH